MATRDYASLDEEDFYGQPFEVAGRVSIWVGTDELADCPADTDILQDLCGVGYYDIDSQGSYNEDLKAVAIEALLARLSYSKSFSGEVAVAARRRGLVTVKWITVQFDFDYDPSLVKRAVDPRAIFLGSFAYEEEHG